MELEGLSVLLTRPAGEGGDLVLALRELGAQVIVDPAIRRVARPLPTGRLAGLLASGTAGDWLLFTSAHAVERFMSEFERAGLDGASLAGYRVMAVGPATVRRLAGFGLRATLQPSEDHRGEGLLDALEGESLHGRRILWPRPVTVRPLLLDALPARGASLVSLLLYATETAPPPSEELLQRLESLEKLVVTLTSPSCARALPERYGELAMRLDCLSIGPVTTEAARELGLRVLATAKPSCSEGLLETLRRHFAAKGSR